MCVPKCKVKVVTFPAFLPSLFQKKTPKMEAGVLHPSQKQSINFWTNEPRSENRTAQFEGHKKRRVAGFGEV